MRSNGKQVAPDHSSLHTWGYERARESESGKTASEPGILLGGTRSILVSENLDLSVRKLGLQEAA